LFNLLVNGTEWSESRDSMSSSRVFEYTEQNIRDQFSVQGDIDLNALMKLPSVFLQETYGDGNQKVRIGAITHARVSQSEIVLEYAYDSTLPALTNKQLQTLASELDITKFEFSRTHWSVKDVDLYRVLLRNMQPRRQQPKVFSISDPEQIEPSLVSAMMPFHPSFDNVYSTLQVIASKYGFRCRRADDIWENPSVIQDVVSLIDHSKIVICDCSSRNPNVFYETGIAHALGRETILITQSTDDIPFDLRHLRYVHYLNNGEGLEKLKEDLKVRFESIT
jgi:hypothetical protein